MAVSPDGKTAYVSNTSSGTVAPIDVESGEVGDPIEVGQTPAGVAVSPGADADDEPHHTGNGAIS